MKELWQKNSLKEFLMASGNLNKETTDRILSEATESNRSVIDLLLSKGLIDEKKLRDLLAEYTGLRVGEVPFGLGIETYKYINFKLANRYHLTAFDVSFEAVKLATDDPTDLEMREIVDFLSRARNVKIELYVVTRSEMIKLLDNYGTLLVDNNLLSAEKLTEIKKSFAKSVNHQTDKPNQDKQEGDIYAIESAASAEERVKELKSQASVLEDAYSAEQKSWLKMLQEKVQSLDDMQKVVSTRDIPRMVAAFVHYAIYVGASDIHIEALTNKVRVRFRIDGILEEIIQLDKSLQPALISRIKILALLKIDEHRVPQDGQFRVTFDGRLVDLRISALPTVYGEKVVIRILDVSSGRLTLDQLGMQGINKKKVEKNIKRSNGMILSTGPTGSGKSTTLFSILGIVSVPGVNVITLEDPVEYHIPGVNQCQINSEIGFTFARGLRSILRQDPNIIMVGEIRDVETAELAVHASLTGHLVLSTLHTNDAPSAVPRLIDMGVEPFLITSSLVLLMAQRLTRKICQHCRQEIKLPDTKYEEVRKALQNIPAEHLQEIKIDLNNIKFYHGTGCTYCKNTGYQGRMAIYEVMEMSDQIQELAVKKVSAMELFDQAVKEGMITMRQDGFMKAMQGVTTLEEVYRVTTK